MKKIVCFCFFVFIFISCSPKHDTSRTKKIQPAKEGKYLVASTNLELNEKAQITPPKERYLRGAKTKSGKTFYFADLIKHTGSCLNFNVNVPNDEAMYESESGKKIPYIGFALFPTSKSNTDKDYVLPFFNNVIPKMMKVNAKPKFADTNKKYPLIVFAHGWTNYPLWEMPFLKLLASNGYVVLTLFLGDSRFKKFFPNDGVHLQQLPLRILALKNAVDKFKSNSKFNKYIDFNNVGLAGISFGGATVAALAGCKMNIENNLKQVAKISNVKAVMGVVPYMGSEHYMVWGDNVNLKEISAPYLAIASNKDEYIDFPFLTSIIKHIEDPKYMVELDNVGHSFTPEMNKIKNTLAVNFFNAYLKQDKIALKNINNVKNIENVKQKMAFIDFD